MNTKNIDPNKWYNLTTTATFFPSDKTDGPVSVITIRRWINAGLLAAEKRRRGKKRYSYFVQGRAILAKLEEDVIEPAVEVPPSQAELNKKDAEVRARLKALGVM